MKKQKKILVQIIVFLTILLSSCQVFATDLSEKVDVQISDSFLQWLEKSIEESDDIATMPRMYDISKAKLVSTNPFKLARMLGSTVSSNRYSLQDIIPENMVIKNQYQTNSCWTFASLAALESNLALKNHKNKLEPVVYDFSERHMEYATSLTFKEGTNSYGFNRKVDDGGNALIFMPYLTNGIGAVAESSLQFEPNNNAILSLNDINKEVVTQVNDIVTFASYEPTDDKTEIKKLMKDHIKNYGAISVTIHGVGPYDSNCYDSEYSSIYCNHANIPVDEAHAVAIVGWIDDFPKENFAQQPKNDGAWIIKNSWGTKINDTVIGDDGFMYISYDDYFVYSALTGVQDAQDKVEYENLYQYDKFGGHTSVAATSNKGYLATIFDKKTQGIEYLTQVSMMAPEAYTCKAYVNPNGTSKEMNDLQQVNLKSGDTESFGAGYHTIEFAEPIQITGENFLVMLEIDGLQSNETSMLMEFNFKDNIEWFLTILNYGLKEEQKYTEQDLVNVVDHIYDNVTLATEKCFFTFEEELKSGIWYDASDAYKLTGGELPNFNTTIKAFTTSKIFEGIEIKTPPTRTEYIVGQDFDATGMVVNAKYTNGDLEEIADYTILNGKDLQLGQTEITIEYQGKTTAQPINIVENTLESLMIECPPTKSEYIEGEDFNIEGMIVIGIYRDGTSKTITNYTITDGNNLKNEQTTVTIEYEGKTVAQSVTVKANNVVQLKITQQPNKVNYVTGQCFNSTGMKVQAIYANGIEKEITDYMILDGDKLQQGQTTVTIEYEGNTVTQAINVVTKIVESISIKEKPTKTQYIQNKEQLDLTGGIIEISYNDQTKEEIQMTSTDVTASGFDNKEIGTKTITVTYEQKTAQFDIEIIEEPKPENSNFDNMKGKVGRIRSYSFTDTSKDEYIVINVELTDIIKSEVNDSTEYYYYLTPKSDETNIINWIKINSVKDITNGVSFEISTSDISNFEEVSNSDNLYLYVKEVATRNSMQNEVITSAIKLTTENVNIETYLDGEKVADINPETGVIQAGNQDPTLAPGKIPYAGKNLLMICLILAVIALGRFAYLKYRDIQI